MSIEDAKRVAAEEAARWIHPHSIVGLGTGSTANYFIHALASHVDAGLILNAVVASSERSFALAKSLGLPITLLNQVDHVDITVDGADAIDPKKRMIKGGGGAHVREKILAAFSHEMVVIVDKSKVVKNFSHLRLPVEILPYGSKVTEKQIGKQGFSGSWREKPDGTLFLSENGNNILDIQLGPNVRSPEKIHETLIQIPGVIDTGFFFQLAGRVIIGYNDGRFEIRS